MKSKKSSTNNFDWHDSIIKLQGKNPSQNIKKLIEFGIETIYDLAFVFPLRITQIPPLMNFENAQIGQIFHGRGTIHSINARPNFWAKGKGKAMLYNITLTVKEINSYRMMYLSWFNCYSSTKNKLESLKEIEFWGEVAEYKSILQISNPEYFDANGEVITHFADKKIKYPTVNTVPGIYINKLIDKIPKPMWDSVDESLPQTVLKNRKLLSIQETLKNLHGKTQKEGEDDEKEITEATKRLIYEEFFQEQIKIYARRKNIKRETATKFSITDQALHQYLKLLPYELTQDQKKCLDDIKQDFLSGHPMMRMIQGDVGSGKTSVAFIASLIVMATRSQVALMVPTEALATQHFLNFKNLLKDTHFKIGLLLGSTPAKEKKVVIQALKNNEIQLVIGTHALFQDQIEFSKLELAIIDEQHKFGVEQRIKLMKKGNSPHTLIMTATPIPRSLSLTQYGDLDFSTIKTMPGGRKGIKTRIVETQNFEKFLSFIKTRISLGEQAYVVVPAIEESETVSMQNLEDTFQDFKKYFPDLSIDFLHGKMKAEEKAKSLDAFVANKTKILISTSVIEVGINVINATIMAIMSPERFGLSSLHQLRGRVGRGDKPGFCFLVISEKLSEEQQKRLKVIENNLDGFLIAEADLEIRGEGNLFGTEQSGTTLRRFANLTRDFHVLEQVKQDIQILEDKKDQEFLSLVGKTLQNPKIFATI